MISDAGLQNTFDSYFIDYASMDDVDEAGHHQVFHRHVQILWLKDSRFLVHSFLEYLLQQIS